MIAATIREIQRDLLMPSRTPLIRSESALSSLYQWNEPSPWAGRVIDPDVSWNDSTPMVIIGPYMNRAKMMKNTSRIGFDRLIGRKTIATNGMAMITSAMRYQTYVITRPPGSSRTAA